MAKQQTLAIGKKVKVSAYVRKQGKLPPRDTKGKFKKKPRG